MIKHLIKLDFYAMKPLKKVILPFLLVPIVHDGVSQQLSAAQ